MRLCNTPAITACSEYVARARRRGQVASAHTSALRSHRSLRPRSGEHSCSTSTQRCRRSAPDDPRAGATRLGSPLRTTTPPGGLAFSGRRAHQPSDSTTCATPTPPCSLDRKRQSGRVRTTRPRAPRLHHGHLPTRHARHRRHRRVPLRLHVVHTAWPTSQLPKASRRRLSW